MFTYLHFLKQLITCNLVSYPKHPFSGGSLTPPPTSFMQGYSQYILSFNDNAR